jgi:hypothetical protein
MVSAGCARKACFDNAVYASRFDSRVRVLVTVM